MGDRTLRTLRGRAQRRPELPRFDPPRWTASGPAAACLRAHPKLRVRSGLRRRSGILGFQTCRRASLFMTGVFGVAKGMSGAVLQQLLDNLAFALSFRREACAALRSVCPAARARRGEQFLRMCGQLPDKVVAARAVLPLTEISVWARVREEVYATDALVLCGPRAHGEFQLVGGCEAGRHAGGHDQRAAVAGSGTAAPSSCWTPACCWERRRAADLRPKG